MKSVRHIVWNKAWYKISTSDTLGEKAWAKAKHGFWIKFPQENVLSIRGAIEGQLVKNINITYHGYPK